MRDARDMLFLTGEGAAPDDGTDVDEIAADAGVDEGIRDTGMDK